MARLNLLEETRYEKIPVSVYENKHIASKMVSKKIADIILERQAKGSKTILGLAKGSTPIELYDELIRLHKDDGLCSKDVISFHLDEYFPMSPASKQSYVSFMNKRLFHHIDILKGNINIPDGTLDKKTYEVEMAVPLSPQEVERKKSNISTPVPKE